MRDNLATFPPLPVATHVTWTAAPYGVTANGDAVELHTLTNTSGVEVAFLTLGGIIVSIRVPDRNGRLDDVVLGCDSLAEYQRPHLPYFGAIIGRYANRIGSARFVLDGVAYQLAANRSPNALHGGVRGFDKVIWHAEPTPRRDGVMLRYTSVDGEEGYPGALQVTVTYRLSDDAVLSVDYDATTDRATPVNFTQHSYFNLGGHASGDVLDHELTIHASRFTPVDGDLIPTGEVASVEGTPLDFRHSTLIGARIHSDDARLRSAHGYDHNYVLDRESLGGTLAAAARVVHVRTGRTLDVATTEPAMQLYTANTFDGSLRGKGGGHYAAYAGLCLETQHFPDSPNHPEFPSTILRPGDSFHSRTTFAFGVLL